MPPVDRAPWLPCPEHLVKLTLPDGRTVWMRTDKTSNGRAQNVVWVNREDLLVMWRRTSFVQQALIACGSEASWRGERKFHEAEKGFAAGERSPVPLAEAVLDERKKALYFVNGVTRTIWLLANGVTKFPIDLVSGTSETHPGTVAAPDLQVAFLRHRSRSPSSRVAVAILAAALLVAAVLWTVWVLRTVGCDGGPSIKARSAARAELVSAPSRRAPSVLDGVRFARGRLVLV